MKLEIEAHISTESGDRQATFKYNNAEEVMSAIDSYRLLGDKLSVRVVAHEGDAYNMLKVIERWQNGDF